MMEEARSQDMVFQAQTWVSKNNIFCPFLPRGATQYTHRRVIETNSEVLRPAAWGFKYGFTKYWR